jgi:hypothetical protein
MDVTRTKDQKLFSLGKKFAQLIADCKKLRATTRTFYLKNWKLTNFDEDKINQLDSHINKIEYELEYMLCLYRILCDVRFKSVESGVGIPYPEYAIVIPGVLKYCYLNSLIFRGF